MSDIARICQSAGQHTTEREIHTSVPEHQVLLSFNDDDGAVLWEHWYDEHGRSAFLKWLQTEEATEVVKSGDV